MSRSGYSDEGESWQMIMYRGAVLSSIRGKRGQEFLKELIVVLDGMKAKRLITDELESHGEFCTLGVIGQSRGLDMSKLEVDEPELIAKAFNIAPALAREIVYENDESQYYACNSQETPENRWDRMRKWAVDNITK